MDVRCGETDQTWYRSERFLRIGDGWYFLTRENTQEGPFASKDEAERELYYYIRQARQWDILQSVKTKTEVKKAS